MNENDKPLTERVATAPQICERDPSLVTELLATLKITRLFIITAHDANAPYVKVILGKVDATIAKAEGRL